MLNISLVFLKQYFFTERKSIRLNSAHIFIMAIPNKQKLQQIAFNHLSDIAFKNFMNFYKICNFKRYSFSLLILTLASDKSLRFKENILERI